MINIYTDSSLLTPLKQLQVHPFEDGETANFILTAFTGAELGLAVKVTENSFYTLQPTEYLVVDETVSLVQPLVNGETLLLLPIDFSLQDLDNSEGLIITGTFAVQRDSQNVYSDLRLTSFRYPQDDYFVTKTATFIDGVSSDFFGLTPDQYAGCTIILDGVYLGAVLTNDAISITLDNSFSGTGVLELYSVGNIEFALTSSDAFYPVLTLPDIDTDSPVVVYFKQDLQVETGLVEFGSIRLFGSEA